MSLKSKIGELFAKYKNFSYKIWSFSFVNLISDRSLICMTAFKLNENNETLSLKNETHKG